MSGDSAMHSREILCAILVMWVFMLAMDRSYMPAHRRLASSFPAHHIETYYQLEGFFKEFDPDIIGWVTVFIHLFLCADPCIESNPPGGARQMGKMHKKSGEFFCDTTVILLYVHNLSTLIKGKKDVK